MYGQRICYSLPSDDGVSDSETIELLDFAPFRSWRPPTLQPLVPKDDSHVIIQPNVVAKGYVFTAVITTDLAYHIAQYPYPVPPSRGHFIDEHHLLFIQVSKPSFVEYSFVDESEL